MKSKYFMLIVLLVLVGCSKPRSDQYYIDLCFDWCAKIGKTPTEIRWNNEVDRLHCVCRESTKNEK